MFNKTSWSIVLLLRINISIDFNSSEDDNIIYNNIGINSYLINSIDISNNL